MSSARVVIVGGGFGGLATAAALARSAADVVLIDRENHHCFQPLLYQVATASLSPADVAWPIRSILRNQQNARVVMGEVVDLDVTNSVVRTAGSGEYSFDYLVIAAGATHSYFGHDDWAAYAPGLKRIEDATQIRSRMLAAFERAEIEADPLERERLMTFVVIGGGATGVEMAGAIADTAYSSLRQEFRQIDPSLARVILLEAAPRVLSSFPENLASYASKALQHRRVEVRTSSPVTACGAFGVMTPKGIIRAGTVIWAAGVRASPAARWIGAAQDLAGRLIVNPDLSVPHHPNIFAVGDTAAVRGQRVPGIAPAAKQMGKYVGELIARRIEGFTSGPDFAYRHYGDLATIGRKSAIVSIGRLQLSGFPAWVFWSVAHIYFLIGARNRAIVALDWLWEYITFRRGARLISGQDRLPHERPKMSAGEASQLVQAPRSTPEQFISHAQRQL
jgi:NADH:ubiquinone reductase (H+-translocating)